MASNRMATTLVASSTPLRASAEATSLSGQPFAEVGNTTLVKRSSQFPYCRPLEDWGLHAGYPSERTLGAQPLGAVHLLTRVPLSACSYTTSDQRPAETTLRRKR